MSKGPTVGIVAGKSARKNGIIPFGQLPNWIRPLPISGDAKVIYVFLHELAMKFENNVFPTYETIAKETSVGVRSISRHLNSLEAVGAITRQQRRNKQRRTSNIYMVNVVPPDNLEFRIATLDSWKPGEVEAL